jgi:hypothetical protein
MTAAESPGLSLDELVGLLSQELGAAVDQASAPAEPTPVWTVRWAADPGASPSPVTTVTVQVRAVSPAAAMEISLATTRTWLDLGAGLSCTVTRAED